MAEQIRQHLAALPGSGMLLLAENFYFGCAALISLLARLLTAQKKRRRPITSLRGSAGEREWCW
ncbi:hypothetical protein ORI60_40245 [Lentzea sp. NEAU-D7]|nr:hypothetical protein [Lentzea sp. NEAU-D7]